MDLFKVYSPFEIELSKGKGYYVFDTNGQQYLDFYGGHAVISIGHSHPHFIQRIQSQLELLPFYSNSVLMPLQTELAQKLGKLSGLPEYQLFLCNSGAEANENALKLASFETGKSKVVAFERAFHGRTSAAVNVTHNEKVKAPINKTFEVDFLPWNDIHAVERVLKNGDVCAVILEGIQGVGGVQTSSKTFLESLSYLCKQHQVMLIMDEIQSGYGRSGHFFSFQKANIQPDIISMAKGMGNGFPIGGILVHPSIKAVPGRLGTTFGGNHLACAAGLAVLEVLASENLVANTIEMGRYFKSRLLELPKIKELRGEGLMIGLEMEFPIKELRKQMLFEQKVFTGNSSNPNVLRLLPPLSIDQETIDLFIEKLKSCL